LSVAENEGCELLKCRGCDHARNSDRKHLGNSSGAIKIQPLRLIY